MAGVYPLWLVATRAPRAGVSVFLDAGAATARLSHSILWHLGTNGIVTAQPSKVVTEASIQDVGDGLSSLNPFEMESIHITSHATVTYAKFLAKSRTRFLRALNN